MRDIEFIVIHHTAVDQSHLPTLLTSINNNHRQRLHPQPNGFGNHIAYHYIIDINGVVEHTRPLTEIGYHSNQNNINQKSIGIALSGNFDKHGPNDAQYKACLNLINQLKQQFLGLTVHPHNEFANKTCPGSHFSFYKLYNSIMRYYEKLRKDNFAKIPKDQRIFRNPEAFIQRTKDLPLDEKFSELTFLIAILSEKLGQRDKARG